MPRLSGHKVKVLVGSDEIQGSTWEMTDTVETHAVNVFGENYMRRVVGVGDVTGSMELPVRSGSENARNTGHGGLTTGAILTNVAFYLQRTDAVPFVTLPEVIVQEVSYSADVSGAVTMSVSFETNSDPVYQNPVV